MIVQLKGNVKFPITLDIGSWIFDNRKIEFDTIFDSNTNTLNHDDEEVRRISKAWDREVNPNQIQDSVNPGLSRKERNKILETTYAMSIKPFLNNAEPNDDSKGVVLVTEQGDDAEISMTDFVNGYFLFALEGKKLSDGPLHFYFGDGSNKDTPIKHIYELRVI